ncbi:hypothetical protein FRB90_010061 [Tulasnella sp. 427]|nr:hypothetical protein FRB90_010061 [Tulasnella sp. 427]
MFTFLSLPLSLLAFTGLSLFQAARALPLSASNSTSVQNQDDSFNTLVSLAPFADPPRNKTSVQKVKVQVTALPNADIDAFVPYTRLASASYCSTAQIKNWTCGQHCGALPGMVIYDAGGNNQDVPFWYVGYLPSLQSAVVAHQGTTPSELKSVLVDTTFHLGSLNAKYFPGIDSSVQVHQGFSTCHGKTADRINSAVKQMINDHSITNVVTVGHSLGGALAVLDAMSLQMVLPSTVRFKVVTFGQPRIGNQQFADFMDARKSEFQGQSGSH